LTSPSRYRTACLLLALATTIIPLAPAQQPASRTLIFLDPAHGGPDTGAHLPNNLLEKDITLAFAARLRSALGASGFSVISTRDTDPVALLTTDQRAEIGNHARPAACLILHASSSGAGVHVITSALPSVSESEEPRAAIPWDTAQAAFIPQSLSLANEIGLSLERAKLPVILSHASLRPVDNLTCPAVAIEIAPLTVADNNPTPVNDAGYQAKVAKAIAAALVSWRNHNAPAPGAAR
jgi:N-acetylmuramoyl-L-alanine amidase